MKYQQSYNPRRPYYVYQAKEWTTIARHPHDQAIKSVPWISPRVHKLMRDTVKQLNDAEQEKG